MQNLTSEKIKKLNALIEMQLEMYDADTLRDFEYGFLKSGEVYSHCLCSMNESLFIYDVFIGDELEVMDIVLNKEILEPSQIELILKEVV